ncbi:MAG: LD-carboxypeptidase [Cyanobacteria bacterium]|nr:LD-carboxypeptidase [Cyanobacteriota bacterium]
MPTSSVKPLALKPGARLAVVSPAGPTLPVEDLLRGKSLLESLGFDVCLMPHSGDSQFYLAGDDRDRANDLLQALLDPDIDGIICARGGYGCMRILDLLDYEALRAQARPKPIIGFSDVTALLLALYQKLGWTSFYGPMLTSNLIHQEPDSLHDLLVMVSLETNRYLDASESNPIPINNRDPYHCLKAGQAEGQLVGGNLSLLSALCGTPYQPEVRGKLLFIEDWKESYYSLDRQFQQLRMTGILEQAAGIILCDFSDIEPPTGYTQVEIESSYPLSELLRELTRGLNIPIGYGFSVGHGEQTGTLPVGIMARWDSTLGALSLLESPVTQA